MSPELVAAIVVAAVAAVTLLARRLHIADPILLVVGGAALAFVPGLPAVEVSPELLLLVVLPPMLFWHAFIVTPREIRPNAGAIGLLAIALVVATALGVALVAHHLAGLPWAAAIALGAIVGPTDPVAFLTVARRLGVSPRLVGLLDGENLLNDFTALVLYAVAVEAAVSGAFSAPDAALQFVLTAVAGLAIGVVVGLLVSSVNARVDDPLTAPVITLCGAYLAFLPAEALHVSAILAAGAAGRIAGARSPRVDRPHTRLTGYAFWDTWIFLLTAVLFVLIGLQLPVILNGLTADRTVGFLVGLAAATVAAVVLIRMSWVFAMAFGIPPIGRRMRLDGNPRPWPEAVVAGWSGMRGAISLVVALALPADFPERDLIVFLAYAVIFVTLVGQGLTLPVLIRRLPLERDTITEPETRLVRQETARAALHRLDQTPVDGVNPADREALRRYYHQRAYGNDTDPASVRMEQGLIDAERAAALELRRREQVGDDVLREHERDLDMRSLLSQDKRRHLN